MSRAVLAMCGLADAPHAVAASVLTALFAAVKLRQPIGRYALVVSPEHAYLALRLELIDSYHAMSMHKLAAAVARRNARRDELLVVAVGEDAPVFRSIPLGPVRHAFAAAVEKEGGSS